MGWRQPRGLPSRAAGPIGTPAGAGVPSAAKAPPEAHRDGRAHATSLHGAEGLHGCWVGCCRGGSRETRGAAGAGGTQERELAQSALRTLIQLGLHCSPAAAQALSCDCNCHLARRAGPSPHPCSTALCPLPPPMTGAHPTLMHQDDHLHRTRPWRELRRASAQAARGSGSGGGSMSARACMRADWRMDWVAEVWAACGGARQSALRKLLGLRCTGIPAPALQQTVAAAVAGPNARSLKSLGKRAALHDARPDGAGGQWGLGGFWGEMGGARRRAARDGGRTANGQCRSASVFGLTAQKLAAQMGQHYQEACNGGCSRDRRRSAREDG